MMTSLRLLWCLLCAALLVHSSQANTFIWDPSSPGNMDTWRRPVAPFANPPVCVPIPANLTLCYGINLQYTDMKIPNLLNHDSLNEVIEQSVSWSHLVNLKCHADTQLFLCSLFTPICLDQTIPPCRSLCEDVQRSCEPYMRKHGYSWPAMMRCDQFPLDNNMCIQTQSSRPSPSPAESPSRPKVTFASNNGGGGQGRANQTATNALEDDKFYRRLLDLICKSDWVIKSGAINVRASQLRVKKYKLIYGNLDHAHAPLTVSVSQKANAISDTSTNMKRKKFVIVGVGNGREGRLTARTVINWTRGLKKVLKKAKSGRCRPPRAGARIP